LISLVLLGGEFWEKLRALFVDQSPAETLAAADAAIYLRLRQQRDDRTLVLITIPGAG
jgi:hypothetical protein